MIGERVAAQAELWVNVPFAWQGRVRAGCDCKGLVAGIARELGRPEADTLPAAAGDYGTKVDTRRLLAGMADLFDRVTEVLPGDLLVLNEGGQPQHLAIAAPTPGKPSRTIQALHKGPMRVVAVRVPRAKVHSIWRWRDAA